MERRELIRELVEIKEKLNGSRLTRKERKILQKRMNKIRTKLNELEFYKHRSREITYQIVDGYKQASKKLWKKIKGKQVSKNFIKSFRSKLFPQFELISVRFKKGTGRFTVKLISRISKDLILKFGNGYIYQGLEDFRGWKKEALRTEILREISEYC